MKWIDAFLNKITMYRLVLYGLGVMVVWALLASLLGFLSVPFLSLLESLGLLMVFCFISNEVIAKVLKISANSESMLITALILFFVLSPPGNWSDAGVLVVASIIAMASKYILVYRKKHIFNPAAIAAVIIGVAGSGMAMWWVGNLVMLPVVLIVGFLILRKIHRFHLFFAFTLTAILGMLVMSVFQHAAVVSVLSSFLVSWPVIFFASVMLTEPLTTPPTKKLQVVYGGLVGVLFAVPFHAGPVFSTPELALVLGNIFSFAVTPKQKLVLKLKSKIKIAQNTFNFAFESTKPLQFQPGQYAEWTLAHENPDGRGNRRYFTISSSPTEKELQIGIKIFSDSSSFKKNLAAMNVGNTITVSHATGDFLLPKDQTKKLVFIAGGIGITPFRSMIQYLLDKNEKRDIVLIYSNKTPEDVAYADVFDRAKQRLGIKVIYTISDSSSAQLATWQGRVGFVDKKLIETEVDDYRERMFYISGPFAMVECFESMLKGMKVKHKNIKTDFFPGFAS